MTNALLCLISRFTDRTGALLPVHPIENRSNQPVNRDNEKRGHWRGHDAAKEDCKSPSNLNTRERHAVDEISPFAPHERGTTLAYKVWNEMSFVKDAEEDERL